MQHFMKPKWSTQRQTDSRGFTLIELLVVISLISLLIAILLPVLSSARRVAQEMICKTNLRTLHLATTMYAHDNKMVLPGRKGLGLHGYYAPMHMEIWDESWVSHLVLFDYLPDASKVAKPINGVGVYVKGYVGTDVGWCPIYMKTRTAWRSTSALGYIARTSYGINGFLDNESMEMQSVIPSKTFLAGDANKETFSPSDTVTTYKPAGYVPPTAIHDKGFHIVYMDSHVESRKPGTLLHPHTTPGDRDFWGFHDTGEAANDLPGY